MTTDFVDPDGDVTTEWSSTAGGHYTEIDDGQRQPATGAPLNEADYIHQLGQAGNKDDEFNMGTIADVDEVTAIKVWIFVESDLAASGSQVDGDINLGGAQGAKTIFLSTDAKGWYSVEWTGLTGSQADLDALKVKLSFVETDGHEIFVYAMYAEITFTEVAKTRVRVEMLGSC